MLTILRCVPMLLMIFCMQPYPAFYLESEMFGNVRLDIFLSSAGPGVGVNAE